MSAAEQWRAKNKPAGANGVPGPDAPPGTEYRPLTWPDPIPASQLKAGDPLRTWLWKGFLARGEITLMSALWKSGKTTLIAHLLKAFEEGGLFLGYPVSAARVLYITEESEGRWAERRDKLGLKDHLEFLVRPFSGKPNPAQWESFLLHAGRLQKERKYDVIIMDTLSNLWPVKDENDACGVQAALMPLHGLGEDVALGLVHHTRKSDGPEATASRGSGALTGFVDTILEFRRHMPGDRKDRRRVLTGYGRHDETPHELVIELTDDGYQAQGDREEIARLELAAVVAGLLPAVPPGLTLAEILAQWPGPPPGRNRLLAVLLTGFEQNRWLRDGDGRKGSPYRYFGPQEDCF